MSAVAVYTLAPGTVIKFAGKEYRLVRPKRTNYAIEDRDGRQFNLCMTASVEVVEGAKWDTGSASVQVLPARPSLKLAQAVKITGRGAGRYEGKFGYVAKVNASTYGVLIPNEGIVNASHGLVVAE